MLLDLTSLVSRFEELTGRAQAFIGGLQRRIDLQGAEIEDFLSYKERLVDYLERFIGELVMATSEISRLLGEMEAADPDRLLLMAARRQVVDSVDPEQALAGALAGWRQRWQGLRAWFIGSGGSSQAEILRARARSAIPALLGAVEALHEQRASRSDRSTDLRTLARWFAQTDRREDAHRLWRAAFGLSSSRHLRVDAASLDRDDQEPVAPSTSWLDAPPLRLTPRLRKTGRFARRGARPVVDRSKAKQQLAILAAEENRQIQAARRRLATDGRIRLSSIGQLEDDAFALFLDLLGEALARRGPAAETVVATSSDGALEIVLEPLPPDAEAMAVLETPRGRFSGPDHWVDIRLLYEAAS